MVVLRKGQQALADHEMGCIICLSGHQREELTCIDCHKTMGLDAFAKTHRKDRENAVDSDLLLQRRANADAT